MSYLSGSIVNSQSLNGVVSISDGSNLLIENGSITNVEFLDVKQMEIDDLKAQLIRPAGSTLQIGEIGKSISLIGDSILVSGNTFIESVNVEFSDHNLLLNYDGGDLLLEGSGISVCGDNNDVKASIVLDAYGDWNVSSVNNKLSVDNLVCGNLTVQNPPIYNTLTAANVIATNKFVSSNRAIIYNTVSYSTAVSHLNCKDIKANDIRTRFLSSANLLTTGDIVSKGNVSMSGLSFLGTSPFRIEYGTTNTVNTSITITFDTPFNSPPTVISLGFINDPTPPLVYVRGITTTDALLYAKNTSGNYGNLKFCWMAIGI